MTLYDLLFPPMCPYCGELTEQVCEACSHCRSLTEIAPHTQRISDVTDVFSAYEYEGVVRRAIINYKFRSHGQYAKSFALTYLRVIDQAGLNQKYDIFTSVPTHHHAEQGRFDQVKRIARPVARIAQTEYRQLLRPARKASPQHTLSQVERIENVKGLYEAVSPQYIEGKRILLFDDVVTTGSTLRECSAILLNAGAEKVDCITLAW